MKKNILIILLLVIALAGFAIGAGFDGNNLFFMDGNGKTLTLSPFSYTGNTSDTVVGATATQTLTNKTMTSPTITTPSVTGGTFTSPVINDPTFEYAVVTMTTSYSVLTANKGKVHTNLGVGAAVAVTMPECSTAIGMPFKFAVVDAHTVNIDVNAADQIIPLTNSAGDSIQTTGTAGDFIELMCLDNTYMIQINDEVGTWADAN